jgi:hypothetical protein
MVFRKGFGIGTEVPRDLSTWEASGAQLPDEPT